MTKESQFHFLTGNKSVGPFSGAQLQALYDASTIQGTTLVWSDTDAQWIIYDERFNNSGSAPQPTPINISHSEIGDFTPDRTSFLRPGEHSGGHISENASAGKFSYLRKSNTQSWTDTAPHPWRRYFARMLDNGIGALLGGAVLLMLTSVVSPTAYDKVMGYLNGPGGLLVDLLVSSVIATLPNALAIGYTGTNIGKWLFGVRVLGTDGNPIGVRRALERELGVLAFGIGLGIPIVAAVTAALCYDALKKNGVTKYDRGKDIVLVHRNNGLDQYIGMLLGGTILIAFIVFTRVAP